MKGVALTYLDPSGRRPEGALDLGSDCRAEPFRFLYLGDEQNSLKSLCSRSFRRAYAAAPDAWFLVHAGDLVQEGFDDHLWGEWSEALGFISASVPSIPVPGNHDLHRPKGYIGHSEVIHPLICRRTARRCQPDSRETPFPAGSPHDPLPTFSFFRPPHCGLKAGSSPSHCLRSGLAEY